MQNEFPPLNSDEADVFSISPSSRELKQGQWQLGSNVTRKKKDVRKKQSSSSLFIIIIIIIIA